MSKGVYSAVPQPMKFARVSLNIYLSMGSVKRLALIPPLKHVGFPARFVKAVSGLHYLFLPGGSAQATTMPLSDPPHLPYRISNCR